MMRALTPALISIGLLAAWLGAALTVAAVVAPAAFEVLPSRALAGALVGRVLPVLFWSGAAVGLLVLWMGWRLPVPATRTAAAVVFVAACLAAQLVIAPRIERIRASIGGPMEALGPLIGENLGAERAPIEVREDGLRHSVRIGDAVDFEIEDIVPFGIESGEPARLTGIFHPAGSELTIAKATRSSIDAFGIAYEGKSAFSKSHFAWAA